VHHIQQKILLGLLYAENLGYAQMRPKGVESNHFSYHLEQLVKNGLVIKRDKQYSLAPEGMQLVDRMSQKKMVDRLQPHIVTAIDLTNAAGESLVYKRYFQPYINRYGFPIGKIHYDESIEAAAARELEEKTGLKNIPLTHRGMVYLESKIDGVTISKVLYHLFDGTTEQQPIITEPHRGEAVWAKHSELAAKELMPGYMAMKKLLAGPKDQLFFAEVSEEMLR